VIGQYVCVRYRLLLGVTIAACFISIGDVAVAQVQGSLVRISSTKSPVLFLNSCSSPPGVQVSVSARGEIVLSRTGPTDHGLTVSYHVTGPVEATSGTAAFGAGSATATIELVPLAKETTSGRPIDLTIVAGSGYGLGSPSHARLQIGSIVTACALPTTSTSTTSLAPRQLPRTGASQSSAMLIGGLLGLALGAALVFVRRERAHR
jgi:LPXTG-motif cell wall-anchored protein